MCFDSETVRGRLGYAFDNVLLYGTGGWAWSSNQYIRTQLTGTLNLATAGTDEAVNTYLSGWTAGGGVAVAFAQNWNVFAEYRYTELRVVHRHAAVLAAVHDFDEQRSANRCRGELQVQLGAPPSAGATLFDRVARRFLDCQTGTPTRRLPFAAFDRLERGLCRWRWRLWLGRIAMEH